MSQKNKLKILFFDIETRYIIFRGWSTGEQYVGHDQIVDGQSPDIICISYKWRGNPEITTLDWGIKAQNSSRMIEQFSKVVESADICIGHNADKFDVKHINTQRMLHGQSPIAWPTSEDTLKQIKKHFALPSYSLDYLSRLIGRKGKKRMQFADWVDIVEKKNPEAMAKMIRYNRHDVLELSAIYNRFFQYLTPKTHVGIIIDSGRDTCPRCGSAFRAKHGKIVLLTGFYQRWRCLGCRTLYRGKKVPNSSIGRA